MYKKEILHLELVFYLLLLYIWPHFHNYWFIFIYHTRTNTFNIYKRMSQTGVPLVVALWLTELEKIRFFPFKPPTQMIIITDRDFKTKHFYVDHKKPHEKFLLRILKNLFFLYIDIHIRKHTTIIYLHWKKIL